MNLPSCTGSAYIDFLVVTCYAVNCLGVAHIPVAPDEHVVYNACTRLLYPPYARYRHALKESRPAAVRTSDVLVVESSTLGTLYLKKISFVHRYRPGMLCARGRH